MPTATATATPSSGPEASPQSGNVAAYLLQLNDGDVWAPDGRHLLLAVEPAPDSAYESWVVSTDGQVTAKLPGQSAGWFDSQTVEEGKFPGDNYSTVKMPRVDLDSIDGKLLSSLAGDYGMLELGAGHVAVTPPHGEGERRSFQVWDGHSLSGTISGQPMSWSPDGKWLIVLHVNSVESGYYAGPLSLLNSRTLADVPVRGWVGSEISQLSFSPNSHYVTDGGTIIDLADESVTSLPPDMDPRAWIGPDTLLLQGTGQAEIWTPEAGFSPTSEDDGGFYAENGSVVSWADSASQLTIDAAGVEQTVALPGPIEGASWSPDGGLLAVTYRVDGDSPADHLVILAAPHFTSTSR